MKEAVTGKAIGRNDPCWCGSGRKFKKCHMGTAVAPPQQASRPLLRNPAALARPRRPGALIKTAEQIAGIRRASALTRDILDELTALVRPGITTNDIDRFVHDTTVERGAVPAPLNYKGFPKSVCTSINHVVCHGIPDETVLKDGDIINIDVTSIVDGYFGDASRMYLVGHVSPAARKLADVTRECMELGIAQVKPGNHVGDIGHAIQTHAERQGYSVVRDFVGHGTGVAFHEDPQIPHFGQPGSGQPILPGMVFTVEPMINAGDWRVKILPDRWTAITVDGALSAQWEHTLLVTQHGVEKLTG